MGTGTGRLNSPEFRGGGGLGGSSDFRGSAGALDIIGPVLVLLGGGMNLLFVSDIKADGRNVSMDRRTGGSGGAGRCRTILLRISTLSFSLRVGRAGRSSKRSLVT